MEAERGLGGGHALQPLPLCRQPEPHLRERTQGTTQKPAERDTYGDIIKQFHLSHLFEVREKVSWALMSVF